MNTHTWRFGLATFVTLALACEPDGRPLGPNTPALSASREGVPFAEGLSSPGWQLTARNLVVQARLGPIPAAHAYPLSIWRYSGPRTQTLSVAAHCSRPIAAPSQARRSWC